MIWDVDNLKNNTMGLPVFDGGLFQGQVAGISVPAEDQLVYHFYDGHTVTKTWARPRKRLKRLRKGVGA